MGTAQVEMAKRQKLSSMCELKAKGQLNAEQEAALAKEFVRSSSRERPNTAAALGLFGQIGPVSLMTSEGGLAMRNLQHASRFNAVTRGTAAESRNEWDQRSAVSIMRVMPRTSTSASAPPPVDARTLERAQSTTVSDAPAMTR
jgi:hypothetical protein